MALTNGPNLGLLCNGAQGEQHYTEFMAFLRGVDGLVMPAVEDKDLTSPPGSPTNGDRYIVGAGATGAWSGHAGKLARYNGTGSAWEFYTPREGWEVYVRDEGASYTYSGSAWVIAGGGSWTAATLLNSWANITGEQAAQYRRDGNRVDVRLAVENGAAATILTLPTGFRPPAAIGVGCDHVDNAAVAAGGLRVDTSGNVTASGPITTNPKVRGTFSFYLS